MNEANTTKKMLDAINLGMMETKAGEFLVPQIAFPDGNVFVGIDSGRHAQFGVVCYTGVDLTANHLFARYVDSGAKIPNVKQALAVFDEYLRQLKTFRIGNVLGVHYGDGTFQLTLESQRPPNRL